MRLAASRHCAIWLSSGTTFEWRKKRSSGFPPHRSPSAATDRSRSVRDDRVCMTLRWSKGDSNSGPPRIADSDLDWGQDINRVATELRARGIGRVFAALQGSADLSRHGFPAHGDLDWYQPATGSIVISLTQWAFGTNPPPYDGYAWLKDFEP